MNAPPEGFLSIDKPCGPTSHDIVHRVRRVLGQPRAGHAGTLDPAASGLLPIMLGRATRLVRFLPQAPKIYEGRLRLGLTTSTDDLQGEVLERSHAPLPRADSVLACAAALCGRGPQVPPTVSARKVGGKRLYRLARAGRPVEAPATEIEVLRFDLEPTEDPAEWGFVAEVSSGTYIRALARDLGRALGCGGTLATLRRTAIGPLLVTDAVELSGEEKPGDERLASAVIPLEAMPLALASLRLDDLSDARRFVAGLPAVARRATESAGPCCVLDAAGQLLGIGDLEAGFVRPRVVIALVSSGPVSSPRR